MNKSLILIAGLTLTLSLPNTSEAANCQEICQAYMTCLEQEYPGGSTAAQQKVIQQSCVQTCQERTETANSCYEDADGKSGAVASCREFSVCILNIN